MSDLGVSDVAFALAVGLCLTLGAVFGSVFYFRRFRLARPAVGVFNGRDVAVMLAFVVVMPLLYVALPTWVLPTMLGLVFFGVLSVSAEPVLRQRWPRRGAIATLLAIDIVAYQTSTFTIVNSIVIVLVCVGAANLNVQGGFTLRHAVWFVLGLAAYDLVFITVIPLTQQLFAAAEGYVFAPVAVVRIGDFATAVGMGDILAYALFGLAAYKAYGRVGLRMAVAVVLVFGAIAPPLAPLAIGSLVGHVPQLIPAQVLFAPAAFAAYQVLRRRRGAERRMVSVVSSAVA
ncbi:MAG TPA: hypothetical protein VFC01_03245 [Mycobacterium sp.]|nr:hypothetical protein [Mycobacterium sp.]